MQMVSGVVVVRGFLFGAGVVVVRGFLFGAVVDDEEGERFIEI